MTHLMTITRFVTQAWDWMDEGAPDLNGPDSFDAAPVVSDLEVKPDLGWVDNFNRRETVQ